MCVCGVCVLFMCSVCGVCESVVYVSEVCVGVCMCVLCLKCVCGVCVWCMCSVRCMCECGVCV